MALFAPACSTTSDGAASAGAAPAVTASPGAAPVGGVPVNTAASVTEVPVTSASPVASASPASTAAAAAPAASANAAASPAPGASAPAEACATYAATHTFAEVTAAKENADGSLAITGHRATVVCGGVDDLHYDIATATETGTVTASGIVQVLGSDIQEQTIAHADFSARLASDQWGRIFMVTGPLTGITTLKEMYHP